MTLGCVAILFFVWTHTSPSALKHIQGAEHIEFGRGHTS
jgi:hypothetical protein